MLVGTGTVETDDPELTVRDEYDEPLAHQPLRAVMGLRELDPQRRVLNDRAADRAPGDPGPCTRRWRCCTTRDRQHVFLEGGPHLAAAFLRADLVDEVVAYVAPRSSVPGTAPWPTWASPPSPRRGGCGSPT